MKRKRQKPAIAEEKRAGYVYVLINPAMKDIVKIGRTINKSEERAAEISRGSGVPTAWRVAYEEFVDDCFEVEKRLHERFAKHRYHQDRECFWMPLKDTIKGLRDEVARRNIYDLLPEIREYYKTEVKQSIASIRLSRRESALWVEITEIDHSGRFTQNSLKLTAKNGDGQDLFSPEKGMFQNARQFLDQMVIRPKTLGCCDLIFTEEAWAERQFSLSLEDKPRMVELRDLLAACDDLNGPHVLWVAYGGAVRIDFLGDMVEWVWRCVNSFRSQYPVGERSYDLGFWSHVQFHYRSWPAGKGYVGKEASENSAWVAKIFNRLIKDYRRNACRRLKWNAKPM